METTTSLFGNKLFEPFTPENTTILMVDFNIGFLPIARSHDPAVHMKAATALLKIALGFNTGLVFNLGKGQTPYPALAEALGDHPILYRGSELNAFERARCAYAYVAEG